ncbi:hypothetical protein DY000_02057504 [Brassica cretica]|uniref:CASP-like protein n=1 Tax=Brassica cretica TaxID=69181 RepID=A0ABQ7A7Y1_BRACR|nr:hypothetical protein DY000_02057504 [Brassica cretica]
MEKSADHHKTSHACSGGAAKEKWEEVSTAFRTAETMLRLAPVLFFFEKNTIRYLVPANGICAGYSLLSAAIAAMRGSSTMPRVWTFFCLDQILTYVVLAAGAVSTEVLYLAYKGDNAITWSDACSSFGSFCHRATASVIITFVVVCLYVILSLISSYKLFTRFDPPATVDSNKNVEVSVFGN